MSAILASSTHAPILTWLRMLLAEAEASSDLPADDAVQRLKDADRLLIAWGNRASHTFDVVRPEAERLIEVCEQAIAVFDCAAGNKPVHRFDDSNETQQCSCGTLRWRYGKLS